MAETAKYQMKNEIGCGFTSAFFAFKGFNQRKAVLFQSNPDSQKHINSPKPIQHENPPSLVKPVSVVKPRRSECREKRSSNTSGPNKPPSHLSTSSSNTSGSNKPSNLSTSSDLSLTLTTDYQRKFDANGTLFRASSGNVMLLGHLGNLKQQQQQQQQGKGSKNDEKDVKKNIIIANNKAVEKRHEFGNVFHNSTKRLNSDVIKSLGNEKYKQGKYEEALKLYNQAISIDPTKACYYSNKSAALMGLGRLLEAVVQCREAIRIDSLYHNAHYRLANLYLRLGLPEKAVYHYKCSGYNKAGTEDFARAEAVKTCIYTCTQAQKHLDWNKLRGEIENVFSLGADSAPMIYAMKAEALMNLRKHEEANALVDKSLAFSSNELYAGIFGSSATAGLLAVRAQIYMSNGRFEDAVIDVEQALTLDSSNKVKKIAERVKCVASARSKGNRLFKGSRITEALVAYNKGLEKDPNNSILLCNRAACRSKLGQYEKAMEDCAAALLVRPNYRKARLRRANCNVQMEKWEAAIQDYEVLMQDIREDEEEDVRDALSQAKMQLNKLHSNEVIL